MRKRIVAAIAALWCVVFFSLSGCGKAAPPPPPPPVKVSVMAAAAGKVPRQVTLIGSVRAFAAVDLVARVGGYLLERNFREGQFVHKGDVLYRIEPYQYDAAVRVAQGDLGVAIATRKNAVITMERQRELVERLATSVQNYDNALAAKVEADSKVEILQGQLEQALLNQSYTRITAPFDGWMGLSSSDVGNLVGPDSGVLATIVDQSRILVLCAPADSDLRILGEHLGVAQAFDNLRIELFLESGEAYPKPGAVVRNDNRIDPSSATTAMLAIFENPDGVLAPGQFVTLNLQSSKVEELLLVPRIAVLSDQTGDYVWVAGDGDKVERHNLVVSQEFDHFVAVSQGVKAGDRIILDNLAKMRAGSAVAAAVSTELDAEFKRLTEVNEAALAPDELKNTYLTRVDTDGEAIRAAVKESSDEVEKSLERDFQTPAVRDTGATDPAGGR